MSWNQLNGREISGHEVERLSVTTVAKTLFLWSLKKIHTLHPFPQRAQPPRADQLSACWSPCDSWRWFLRIKQRRCRSHPSGDRCVQGSNVFPKRAVYGMSICVLGIKMYFFTLWYVLPRSWKSWLDRGGSCPLTFFGYQLSFMPNGSLGLNQRLVHREK